MRLPASVIVIIVIVLLVLIVLVAFFLSTTGSKINEVEADRIFAQQCTELCNQVKENGITFLMTLQDTNPKFIDACEVKYAERAPNVCMGFCGSGCSVIASKQDELCLKSKAMAGSAVENCNRLESLAKYKDDGAVCSSCAFG